jgi:hypothetical protein
MRGREPTDAGMWVTFAASALTHGQMPASTRAAEIADQLCDEFHKRFEWYEGGYGEFYRRKPQKKRRGEA